MDLREQLHYLMEGVLKGTYDVQTFCDEFIRIYNFEEGYEQLSQKEKILYRELCEIAGRFSDDIEDLKLPNVYYSAEEVLGKVKEVEALLKQ